MEFKLGLNKFYKFIIFFIIAFFIPSIAQAAYSDTVAGTSNILYYWPMDEAGGAVSCAATVGGTAINLTGATAGVAGLIDGTAVSFDGDNDSGASAAALNLTTYNKIVVEGLFYFDAFNNVNDLAYEFGTAYNTAGSFRLNPNSSSPSGTFFPYLWGNSGNNSAAYVRPSAAAWHHVVTIFDMSQAVNEVSLYIDGDLQTPSQRPNIVNNTGFFGNLSFYLMSRAGTSLWGQADVQHLAIYSSMDESTITAHYNEAFGLSFVAGVLSEDSHGPDSATVSWTASTNGVGVVSAQLQRSPSGAGTWANVVGATSSPATDTDLDYSTAYDYRVAYTDETPETVYSNTVTITTDADPGTTYTILQADLWDNGYDNVATPRQSFISRFVFITNAASVAVAGTTDIFGSFPLWAQLGVKINGVYQDPLQFSGNGTESFTLNLGDFGTNRTVEIISGIQSQPGLSVIGTYSNSVTYPTGSTLTVQPPTVGDRILVYGDSISVGANATDPEELGWAPLLRDTYTNRVMAEAWGYRSLYDDTNTAELRSAFVSRVAGYTPATIWLAIGTNDYGLNRWSAANFGTAYAATVDDLHTALPSARIVCQTPIDRTTEVANDFGNTTPEYRTQITNVCGARSWATVIDGTQIMETTDLVDGVHPNTAAHATYATFVNNVLTVEPTVTTAVASGISTTGATLNGSMSAIGGSTPTIRGFNYGYTLLYDIDTTVETGSFSTGDFDAALAGLTPNTTYHFRSYSTNFAGSGYGDDQSFATLIETPTGISYDNIATTSLTVSATGNLSKYSESSSGLYFDETSGSAGGADSAWLQVNSYQNTGLTENTQYTFKTKARNRETTETVFSGTSSKYTLIQTPTGISYDNIAATSLTVSATGDLTNIATASSGLYFDETSGSAGGADSAWLQVNSYQNTGLTENTLYTFKTKARNGDSTDTAFSATSSKYTLIQTPTGISYDNIATTSLTVSATGDLTNIATASSGLYFDETSGSAGGADSAWLQVNSYQNTGLTENTLYTFKTKARNGDSTDTAFSATSSKYTLIQTPTGISYDNIAATSLTVSATGDLTNIATASSGLYFDETSGSAGGADSAWLQVNSYQNTGLTENTLYTFKTKARNGDSTDTAFSATSSKYTLIQTPTGISYDNVAATSLTVSATGDLTNIATASSGLYFDETSGSAGGADSAWLQVNSYTDNGLTENTQYTYKAKARNGDSTQTVLSGASSKYTLAGTPTNLEASPNSESVTLTVDDFENDTVGLAGYYFSRAGANSGWIQTNTWNNTGLTCETAYTYSVIYRNSEGVETASISVETATTDCIAAGVLTETTHDDTSITLAWTGGTGGTGTISTQLQRSPSGENEWANVAGATSSPVIDQNLSQSTAYDYRVVYTDEVPTSINSDTVTITTSATADGRSGSVENAIIPTATFLINNGATTSFENNVTLYISAPTAVEMLIGNDINFLGSHWETLSSVKNWTLPIGTGDKTIYFVVRNSGLTTSSVYTQTIKIVDTPVVPAIDINLSLVQLNKTTSLADGAENILVSVVVKMNDGSAAAEKTVVLNSSRAIEDTVVAVNSVTDSNGVAKFELTSKFEGVSTLMATVEGLAIAKTVAVEFTKLTASPEEKIEPDTEKNKDIELKNLNVGDLIKCSSVSSALYYYGSDGKRHSFANETIYHSYYTNFDGVKEISAAQMAGIGLGANAKIRPGTWMIKIQSDPKVYAVTPAGILRWVSSEKIASDLYGSTWNKKIIDIESSYFEDYSIGAPIESSSHPSASLIQYEGDINVYYIDNGTKRKITNMTAFNLNKFQNRFKQIILNSLVYPVGDDISNKEELIAEVVY